MNTEQRIQQATVRLVLQHGYDKTTMEDIAQEAGVARSTIYTKWKTKEALFASVVRAEAIHLARKWYALVEADPDGGTFSGIYKNGLLAIQDNAFAQALYTQNRRVLGSFVSQPEITQLMADRLLWLIRLLEKMQHAGLIRPELDIYAAAQTAVIFRQGLLTIPPDTTPQYQRSYEQLVETFVAMFRQFVEPEAPPHASQTGKQLLRDLLEEFAQEYRP